MLSQELLSILSCPYDGTSLSQEGEETLLCASQHVFPVIEGIPVLLRRNAKDTIWVAETSWALAQKWVRHADRSDPYFLLSLGFSPEETHKLKMALNADPNPKIDPCIKALLGATAGNLYLSLRQNLNQLPSADLRVPKGEGNFLDIGCNWGRWSIAAARRGYTPFGIDPCLGALLTAQRTARRLNLKSYFVCADGRAIPFKDKSFHRAFSYSVIQHMSEEDALASLQEIGRVLAPAGTSMVQMPNCFGLRSLIVQGKRLFRKASGFEVRYWNPGKLLSAFQKTIGDSELQVEGFFCLGAQPTDLAILPPTSRWIVRTSEFFRKAAQHLPFLTFFADSLYVSSKTRQES